MILDRLSVWREKLLIPDLMAYRKERD